MRNLLLALMLAGTHCVFSQETPADKSKHLATLQGRAVISMTGEPVSRVDLALRALPPGTDTVKVVSDADGRFSFEEMEPGSYILSASRPGFQMEVYGARSQSSDGTPLTLSPGQVLKNIEFRLTPLGAISGTVVDDGGKPMSEVRVIATGGTSKSNGAVLTNSTGEFRFPNLAPGSYILMAIPVEGPLAPAARASAGEPDEPEERPATTYYPSAADAVGAIPLEVAPSQELQGIKIAVRKVPLHHVRGKVVTSSAEISPENVRLWLMPRTQASAGGFASSFGDTPAPDGSFDLGGVRPGSYYLAARFSSVTRMSVSFRGEGSDPEVTGLVFVGRAWVDVTDGDVTGVVLRIGDPLQIQGTIRMEGQDKPDLSGLRIQLRLLDGPPGNVTRATLAAENTFALTNVAPGKHAISVSGLPANAYVKSIRLGRQETIDIGLDLTDMQAVPPLEIRIGRDGATVQGTVDRDDDKPAPRAWVALIPDPARPELESKLKSATARDDGRFFLTGVAPGEYRLYAFEQPQPRSLVNLEFYTPLESKSVKLTVKEGERKQTDLTVLQLQ
jgi:hypothetical protein